MVKFRSRNEAFTLIELVVVLGIIAILATVAFTAVDAQVPITQLNTASRDAMVAFNATKIRAVRTGRPHKVCLYLPASGGYSAGNGGYQAIACQDAALCVEQSVCVNDGTGYDTTFVGAGKPWNVPSAVVVPGEPQSSIAPDISRRLDSTLTGFPAIRFASFRKNDGVTAFSSPTVIEIAFDASGFVAPGLTSYEPSTSTALASGGIALATKDARHQRVLRWTAGGSVRIR